MQHSKNQLVGCTGNGPGALVCAHEMERPVAYYDVNITFSIEAHAANMSKRGISVRLSEERLWQLDEACAMLKMNRSQVIDAALRLLPEIASGRAEVTYAPKWLSTHVEGGEDEQN